MPCRINLDNIAVILHRPRYSENIGAAARAVRNMGIGRLVVVDPQNYDVDRVLKLATHVASDIVAQIEIYENLKEALSCYSYVVGTTARLGGQRQIVTTPSKVAENLVAISRENRVAILFGSEDRGLKNEDIRYCHALVSIPTAEFSSLNLAQSVMIMCYEVFIADLQEKAQFTPRFATVHELEGMYDQLKDILVRINYINPENPDYWLDKLRHFFNRMQLRAKEVSIIRGICRQIDWYGRKRCDSSQVQRFKGSRLESDED